MKNLLKFVVKVTGVSAAVIFVGSWINEYRRLSNETETEATDEE